MKKFANIKPISHMFVFLLEIYEYYKKNED